MEYLNNASVCAFTETGKRFCECSGRTNSTIVFRSSHCVTVLFVVSWMTSPRVLIFFHFTRNPKNLHYRDFALEGSLFLMRSAVFSHSRIKCIYADFHYVLFNGDKDFLISLAWNKLCTRLIFKE